MERNADGTWKTTKYAICGKCRKYHREGTKIAEAHQSHMGWFKEIDPGTMYGTRSRRYN